MARDIYKLIYKKIKKYNRIVIARHIGPDPDAVTSQIALRDSIKLTFPEKKVLAVGLGVTRFKNFGILDKSDFQDMEKSLLILTDVPTLERVDGIENLDYEEVIKIDHHPCDKVWADIELVDDTSSSACQLIAEVLFRTPLKINEAIASNLFLGIVSDSDRFLLAYTTSKTFQIVSKLIESQNLNFVSLYDQLYDRPLNEIRFQGYLAENLILKESGLAYILLTPEIITKYNVDLATPSNMINNFNFIKEVFVWTFITYDDKKEIYKVNIRSKGPIINTIAEKYNGGGHKFASGAKLTKKEDVDLLLHDLEESCVHYQKEKC